MFYGLYVEFPKPFPTQGHPRKKEGVELRKGHRFPISEHRFLISEHRFMISEHQFLTQEQLKKSKREIKKASNKKALNKEKEIAFKRFRPREIKKAWDQEKSNTDVIVQETVVLESVTWKKAPKIVGCQLVGQYECQKDCWFFNSATPFELRV